MGKPRIALRPTRSAPAAGRSLPPASWTPGSRGGPLRREVAAALGVPVGPLDPDFRTSRGRQHDNPSDSGSLWSPGRSARVVAPVSHVPLGRGVPLLRGRKEGPLKVTRQSLWRGRGRGRGSHLLPRNMKEGREGVEGGMCRHPGPAHLEPCVSPL